MYDFFTNNTDKANSGPNKQTFNTNPYWNLKPETIPRQSQANEDLQHIGVSELFGRPDKDTILNQQCK